MKKLILLFITIVSTFPFTYSQTEFRTITGLVYDEIDDEPLIGCSVYLKNEKIVGAMTDIDGRFILTFIPGVNDVLEISYVGYNTRRIPVTYESYYRISMKDHYNNYRTWQVQKKTFDPDNEKKDVRGRLTSSNSSHYPLTNYSFRVYNRNISAKTDKEGYFILYGVIDQDPLIDSNGYFFALVGEVTDSVLHVYPDPVFSHQIESKKSGTGVLYMTDDISSSYNNEPLDRISKITQKGDQFKIKQAKDHYFLSVFNMTYTGFLDIGNVAALPDPLYDNNLRDYFRTGISFGNALTVKMPGLKQGETSISLGQKKNNSPIPNAYGEVYNVSLFMRNIQTGKFNSEAGAFYYSEYNKFNQQGANISTLLYSELIQPPTEENKNYFSDHVKNSPDQGKKDYVIAYAKSKIKINNVDINGQISYNNTKDKQHNQYALETFRKFLNTSALLADTESKWRVLDDYNKLDLDIAYNYKHSREEIDYLRNDNPLWYSKYRNSHVVRYGGIWAKDYNNINLEIHNKHYFSNTAKNYTNLFPEIGFSWNMQDFLENNLGLYNYYLKFYISSKRSIGEPSLINTNYAAYSTPFIHQQFTDYYERLDLYENLSSYKNIHPETYWKNEVGLNYSSPLYRTLSLSGEINFFHNVTYDFIYNAPYSGSLFCRENIGRLHNYGYFVSLGYNRNVDSDYGVAFNIRANFSQVRNKVSAIYNLPENRDFYSLAGFSDVATVFAKNETLGAIYGTTYMRNERGEISLDSYGNPEINSDLKKIGDPTPDFIATLSPGFFYKKLGFSFLMEYSHGGERWNGTQAILNNMHKSTMESIAAEDYIQKASYFRMNDLSLSYNVFTDEHSQFVRSLRIKANVQNLFVITPYKGVDPKSLLFGYPAGNGLDLFNLPSTRNYLLTVTLDI